MFIPAVISIVFVHPLKISLVKPSLFRRPPAWSFPSPAARSTRSFRRNPGWKCFPRGNGGKIGEWFSWPFSGDTWWDKIGECLDVVIIWMSLLLISHQLISAVRDGNMCLMGNGMTYKKRPQSESNSVGVLRVFLGSSAVVIQPPCASLIVRQVAERIPILWR